MVLIACNEAIDEEVMEMLGQAGAENYTKWTRVLGRGNTSGPHLGSHVWPKQNNVVALAVEDETADKISAGVEDLRSRLGQEGIKAFVLPLESLT
jgi:hypothetical protein